MTSEYTSASPRVAHFRDTRDLVVREVGMNRQADFRPAKPPSPVELSYRAEVDTLHRRLVRHGDRIMLGASDLPVLEPTHKIRFPFGRHQYGKQMVAGIRI